MALVLPRKRNTQQPHSATVTPPVSKHFRLVEAEDKALNTLLATKTIATHLKKGETVVFVGLAQPKQLARMLTITGINVEQAISNGQLFIFSSQPALMEDLTHTTIYQPLFAELVVLTNVPIDCIVMTDVDALLNLDSQYYAYASISQFMQATDEVGCKVFAQYIKKPTQQQHYLATACRSLVDNYLTMRRNKHNNRYHLRHPS